MAATPAAGQEDWFLQRVATGLARPLFVTAPPGDPERAFIVEQRSGNVGRIRILELDTLTVRATPFLSISPVSIGFEEGLLGMAFHPDYASNRTFFVHYTNSSGNIVIARYQADVGDPNLAVPTATTVLTVAHPSAANHNGGWLGFGPDGYLYAALGDGGGSNDGDNNAQDITGNLLGKILRLDVNGDDFPADPNRNYAIPADNPFVGITGDDEIWAYGLRNPFRASFDRATGDLYIGDVGQGAREEVDVQPAASEGGENYGWRLREGTIATPSGGVGGPKPPGAIDPIFEYTHDFMEEGIWGISVIGGYVYWGAIKQLRGRYFFSDYLNARLWSLRWDGSDPSGFDGTNYTDLVDHGDDPRFLPDVGTLEEVSSFGEDAARNLYVTTVTGEVFRLTPLAVTPGAAALGPLLPAALVAAAWLGLRRARSGARRH